MRVLRFLSALLFFSMLLTISCSDGDRERPSDTADGQKDQSTGAQEATQTGTSKTAGEAENAVSLPITFVELGSVNCIPCKQMQPVMEAIEKKYKNQVNVVFYDVWEPDQKHYAKDYNIRLIPTQVFLDAAGNELFRHEGFFPESDIDKLLAEFGVEIKLSENE